jgi:hypothetical protein
MTQSQGLASYNAIFPSFHHRRLWAALESNVVMQEVQYGFRPNGKDVGSGKGGLWARDEA